MNETALRTRKIMQTNALTPSRKLSNSIDRISLSGTIDALCRFTVLRGRRGNKSDMLLVLELLFRLVAAIIFLLLLHNQSKLREDLHRNPISISVRDRVV